jgi:hypothetical protein
MVVACNATMRFDLLKEGREACVGTSEEEIADSKEKRSMGLLKEREIIEGRCSYEVKAGEAVGVKCEGRRRGRGITHMQGRWMNRGMVKGSPNGSKFGASDGLCLTESGRINCVGGVGGRAIKSCSN